MAVELNLGKVKKTDAELESKDCRGNGRSRRRV